MDNRKKSVVFLITGLGHGGAETQVARIGSELKRRHWNVTVFTILKPTSKSIISKLEQCKIPIHSLDLKSSTPFQSLKDFAKWVQFLEKEKPNALVSLLFHGNILGSALSMMVDIPRYISSVRNISFEADDPQKSKAESRTKLATFFHLFDSITTSNSAIVADALVEQGVLERNKLEVVRNAIELDDFVSDPIKRRATRKEFGLLDTDFLFIAVANIHPRKGYQYLVEASRSLPSHVTLAIVGDGDTTTLQKQIDAEKLDARILLLGYRKDVPALLNAADGFVLPSLAEGLPNVLMEAQASAVPCVATRVGGVEEIALDQHTGFIVPPKDAEALAEGMLKLIQLPQATRAKMGALGREHIRKNFGLHVIADRWEEILEAR